MNLIFQDSNVIYFYDQKRLRKNNWNIGTKQYPTIQIGGIPIVDTRYISLCRYNLF